VFKPRASAFDFEAEPLFSQKTEKNFIKSEETSFRNELSFFPRRKIFDAQIHIRRQIEYSQGLHFNVKKYFLCRFNQ
jgi:hypothetical protein